MKTLHILKQIDFYLQITGLIPILFALALLEPYPIILSYVMVGTTQLVSCIINGVSLKYYQKHTARKEYQFVLTAVAVLVIGIAVLNNEYVRLILICILMIASPFIAVWYMWISYKEMKFARSLANRSQFVNI